MIIPDIDRIAVLSRIKLSEDEKREFSFDLISLNAYADILSELDPPEAPDYYTGEAIPSARKDIPGASPAREIMLMNSPELSDDGKMIAVPKSL